MVALQITTAAVSVPRARAKASASVISGCPSARSGQFARGSGAVRVRRAVVVPAVSRKSASCSLFAGQGKKENKETSWSPVEEVASKDTIFDWVQDGLKKLRTPALALALVATLALAVPDAALAAKSSGRVGGSSFRSSSSGSPSYSRGSSSYSAPSAGYSGYSSSAPIIVSPRPTFGFSSFMPFGWGMPFMGPTVIVGPAPVVYSSGPSFFTIIGFVLFAVLAFSLLSSFMGSAATSDGLVVGGDERVSVAKLQIGLLGIARSLQKDLNRIADNADTSNPEGLHYVLQETVLSLLRHPDYCVYGASATQSTDIDGAEELFNEMSMDERSKFEAETLVNVGSVRKTASRSGSASDMTNEYIVVTLIVAADGNIKLPPIKSLEDLKTALKRLGAVRADGVQAVEVLWTPQQDGDTLTQDQMLRDYPNLTNL